jgi:hypothetical protein
MPSYLKIGITPQINRYSQTQTINDKMNYMNYLEIENMLKKTNRIALKK